MTNHSLKTILLTTATYLSLSSVAMAADTTTTPPLTRQEASDLKTESKAEYKARKNVVEAQKELDVADCKTSGLDAKDERDCKKDAKDAAKASKRHAKDVYKQEKEDINAMKH